MSRRLVGWLTATAVCAWSAQAGAQVPDLVEISAQYMPNVPVVDPRPLEAQVSSYDGALNVPIPLGERTFLIPGVGYHVDAASFAETPPNFIQLRAFHSIDFPLLFVQLLPHDWSLSLRFAPGLAGDFEAVDSDLLRFNALALATHGFSDDFVLGGGALASYGFGTLLPLPALYLEWKPTTALSVEMFLPAFLQAKLSLWDRLELGYRVEVAGNAYAVRDERIAEAWPCVAEAVDSPLPSQDDARAMPSECLDHVAYSVIAAGPTLNVRLFASVWWTNFAGHSIYRRFDMMNADDEPVSGGGQELPNAWLVRSGLTWRIPMD